jgi:hypothetical protein
VKTLEKYGKKANLIEGYGDEPQLMEIVAE